MSHPYDASANLPWPAYEAQSGPVVTPTAVCQVRPDALSASRLAGDDLGAIGRRREATRSVVDRRRRGRRSRRGVASPLPIAPQVVRSPGRFSGPAQTPRLAEAPAMSPAAAPR